MNGFTIEGSIDLLERDVKKLKDQGGGGGGGTAASVSYDHTGTSLVATNVQSAITELDLNVSANVEDIEDLQTDVTNLGLDKQDKLTAGSGIDITDNVISTTGSFPTVSETEVQVGNSMWGPVYQRLLKYTGSSSSFAGNSWYDIGDTGDIDKIFSAYLILCPTTGRSVNYPMICTSTSTTIKVMHTRSAGPNVEPNTYFLIEYTKTT